MLDAFPAFPPPAATLREPLQRLHDMLRLLSERWPAFGETELCRPLKPGGWSRKQLLGHLIDSAANNHRRFMLCLLEPAPFAVVSYDQDGWVACGGYDAAPAEELLQLWRLYNRQLMRLISHIPATALQHRCEFDNGYAVTLAWLVEDYTVHLEHHVRQLVS